MVRMVPWLVALGIGLAALMIYLLSQGSKGNEIAETLSLIVAIASIVLTIVLHRLELRPPEPEPEPVPPRPSWPRRAAVLLTILVGAGGAIAYWFIGERSDINVTGTVVISGPDSLSDRGTVTVRIPGTPPKRKNLALTLTLTNPGPTGDCVDPAIMEVAPVVDGNARPPVDARSGRETRLSLAGLTQRAEVLITLRQDDPGCTVRLNVTKEIIYH